MAFENTSGQRQMTAAAWKAPMLAPAKRKPNLRAIEALPDADLAAIGASRKPQPDKLVLDVTIGDPLKTWNALVGERAAEGL